MKYIYVVTNLVNGLQYVGQTVNPKHRFASLCSGNNGQKICSAIQEYGKENFKMNILEECSTEMADEREKFWISELNTFEGKGYNSHCGGRTFVHGEDHPRYGTKLTEETKEKFRQALIDNGTIKKRQGENHPYYGKKHTAEILQKMSKPKPSVQGDNHPACKTTIEMAENILKEYVPYKVTQKMLAKKYGISNTIVSSITRGEHWSSKYSS